MLHLKAFNGKIKVETDSHQKKTEWAMKEVFDRVFNGMKINTKWKASLFSLKPNQRDENGYEMVIWFSWETQQKLASRKG